MRGHLGRRGRRRLVRESLRGRVGRGGFALVPCTCRSPTQVDRAPGRLPPSPGSLVGKVCPTERLFGRSAGVVVGWKPSGARLADVGSSWGGRGLSEGHSAMSSNPSPSRGEEISLLTSLYQAERADN